MNDIIYKETKIIGTKHKHFNLQIGWYEKLETWFNIGLEWSRRRDHAGFRLDISILWFYFIFYTYDNRHWCEKCDTWMSDVCYKENHNNYSE